MGAKNNTMVLLIVNIFKIHQLSLVVVGRPSAVEITSAAGKAVV